MNKKRLFIVTILGITLALLLSLLAGYMYWCFSKPKSVTNKRYDTCLSIKYDLEGITLSNTVPMTDDDGLNQQGYNFKVINKCEEDLSYLVVLDSVEESKAMINPEYVKISVDRGLILNYRDLSDATPEFIDYKPKASKEIYNGQIPRGVSGMAKEVEHNIKMWISSDLPTEEIGKEFLGKLRVIVGQQLPEQEYALTPGSCFEFDSITGTIIGYDEEQCSTDYLVIPQKINGIIVEKIDFLGNPKNNNECQDCKINWEYIDLSSATELKVIGKSCFDGYMGIGQQLIIPNSVNTIDDRAFQHYIGTNLTLGNGIETISSKAFLHYVGTGKELSIPNSVKTIGGETFSSFNGRNLKLGNSINVIDSSAFKSFIGTDQKLNIPDSTTIIGISAFESYNGTALTLGSSLNTIKNRAFLNYYGTNIELVIPDSVKNIGSSVFLKYSGNNLVLGSGLSTIGDNAFNSFKGTINVKMSETSFNIVSKNDVWKNEFATLHFLK